MAYNVYESDSRIHMTSFVVPDYKISIRENLPGVFCGSKEQTERIKNYLKKYSGVSDLNTRNKSVSL